MGEGSHSADAVRLDEQGVQHVHAAYAGRHLLAAPSEELQPSYRTMHACSPAGLGFRHAQGCAAVQQRAADQQVQGQVCLSALSAAVSSTAENPDARNPQPHLEDAAGEATIQATHACLCHDLPHAVQRIGVPHRVAVDALHLQQPGSLFNRLPKPSVIGAGAAGESVHQQQQPLRHSAGLTGLLPCCVHLRGCDRRGERTCMRRCTKTRGSVTTMFLHPQAALITLVGHP